MLFMKNFIMIGLLVFILLMLFGVSSALLEQGVQSMASFECGFSAYYFSRHSFSIHYFVLSLLFLFLDLELCLLMPFFDGWTEIHLSTYTCMFFILIVLLSLMQEWYEGKLEWLK